MIKGLIALASYDVFDQGWIGTLLGQWEQMGVFSYLLPFLLIFSLVFGILTKIKLFKENKAINAIVALVVGLMAIQFDLVPAFFAQIFPRVGVALIFILGVFIVVGLFVDPENPVINWILLGIAVIVLTIVVVQTAGSMGWATGYWWQNNWPTVVGIIVVVALLIAIIASGNAQGKGPAPLVPTWARDYLGIQGKKSK